MQMRFNVQRVRQRHTAFTIILPWIKIKRQLVIMTVDLLEYRYDFVIQYFIIRPLKRFDLCSKSGISPRRMISHIKIRIQ